LNANTGKRPQTGPVVKNYRPEDPIHPIGWIGFSGYFFAEYLPLMVGLPAISPSLSPLRKKTDENSLKSPASRLAAPRLSFLVFLDITGEHS